jgi:hypothetical protein
MRGLSVLRSIGAAVDDGALHSITSSAWSRSEGEVRSSGKRKTNGDEAPRPSGNLVEFKFPANQGIFLAEEILNFAANHWNYAWQLRVRRGGFPRREQQNSELELPNRELLNCSRPIREFGNSNPAVPDRRVFCVSGFRSRTPPDSGGAGNALGFMLGSPTAAPETRFEHAVTAQQDRASGAGGTIRLASRRGGQLPSHA